MLGKVVAVLLLGLLLQYLYQLGVRFGVHKIIYNHQPGPCRLVKGIENGSEDAALTVDGKLFISSGIQNLFDDKDPIFEKVKGQIFLLDTRAKELVAFSLPILGDFDQSQFKPHGLSLWKDEKKGKLYLYVVNHPVDRDSIEKFLYDPKAKALHYLQSFTDPNIILANDVHVVGEDQFYFTNFNGFRNQMGMVVQAFSPVGFASVGYYDHSRTPADGSRVTLVATGLMVANGINGSPDGRHVNHFVTHQ